MDAFASAARALLGAGVRFVVIGVWGANYYAGGNLFMTLEQDLFVPADAGNLLTAWRVCEQQGLTLETGGQPLDMPRDAHLAEAVVQRRALTTAGDGAMLRIDLTLVMAGFDFEEVWQARRNFEVDGVPVPVASLTHIVLAKAKAARPKDVAFLAAHAEELRLLLARDAKP
jgi:predicted nucleotidyltransferase